MERPRSCRNFRGPKRSRTFTKHWITVMFIPVARVNFQDLLHIRAFEKMQTHKKNLNKLHDDLADLKSHFDGHGEMCPKLHASTVSYKPSLCKILAHISQEDC